MKKKFIIPSLLFACSLTACSDGLVTSGVPYKDGVAATVDESIKNEKKDSFKEIEIKSKAETEISIKVSGDTATVTANATSTIKVNLDEKSVELSMENVAKSGKTKQELKGSIKVKKVNSSYKTISSNGDVSLFSSLDYDSYFTFAAKDVYSWNFSLSDAEIQQALTSVSGSVSSSLGSAINTMKENMLIDGDPAKGTFDVGISKTIPFNIDGVDMKYTKMKYSFKECLLKTNTLGIQASKASGSSSVFFKLSGSYNYDYK